MGGGSVRRRGAVPEGVARKSNKKKKGHERMIWEKAKTEIRP